MKRRAVVIGITQAGLVAALTGLSAQAVAQRPSRPIARPRPPGWGNRPLLPGYLYPQSGGVAGPAAGIFTVVSVQPRDNIMRLRDDAGRSADVYVDSDVFDVSTLQEGDAVAVDFFVPNEGDTRIEAATVYKLETDRP